MKNKWLGLGALGVFVSMGAGGVVLEGCGDDTVLALPDGGTDGSVSFDAPGFEAGNPEDGGENDAASDGGDAGEAQAPLPERLLLSYSSFAGPTELVSWGLQAKAADGVLVYQGFGTTYVTPTSAWALEQQDDVVARLDPLKPWQVQSSWSVALDDYSADAGYSSTYSDPNAVVVGAGTKAYVLRYTRNLIAVIDSSQVADGGAPTKTIDLSSQLQAAGDGYVEMTAGYFDATTQRVYVLLANINRYDVGDNGYVLFCAQTTPTIVAIDTTTDSLVSLPDAGAAGGWTLPGYDPGAMVYDAPDNRLLVLQAGCNQEDSDGGVGALVQREIDSISLTTGAAQKLVDLTSAAFPLSMYYLDSHHVIVVLDTAYMWDPSSSTLGSAIPNAPQEFDIDDAGNLVGLTQTVAADGGAGPVQVLSVNAFDGGTTMLGTNPFPADSGVGAGYISGVQLWPGR